MRLLTGWAIAMGGLWLALSGHYSVLLLGLGAGSVLLVAWLAWAYRLSPGLSASFPLRLVGYLPWLSIQVVKSNLDVASRILLPGSNVKPVLVKIPAGQRGAMGVAIHANSITSTPGTLSLEARSGEILVHALDASIAQDLLTGEFDRRASHLERGRS